MLETNFSVIHPDISGIVIRLRTPTKIYCSQFCGSEQSLAALHESVITNLPKSEHEGFKRLIWL